MLTRPLLSTPFLNNRGLQIGLQLVKIFELKKKKHSQNLQFCKHVTAEFYADSSLQNLHSEFVIPLY